MLDNPVIPVAAGVSSAVYITSEGATGRKAYRQKLRPTLRTTPVMGPGRMPS